VRNLKSLPSVKNCTVPDTWMRRLSSPPGSLLSKTGSNPWITNWAACDGFCNHAVGDFITKYPDQVGVLKRWAISPNRWVRRAACVSLIIPVKHGEYLSEVFELADLVLTDPDDMVQKGYGWLLKEASRKHTHEVFAYVMKKKSVMPRTSLRYAIELMPKELRSEAMKKV